MSWRCGCKTPIREGGGGNAETIKKTTEALLGASKEGGLEVNREEAKYILMSLSQEIGQKIV
jgi:hypothetical protein